MKVAIIGAGMVGAAVAFEATRRKHEVCIFSGYRPGSATLSAAGMLAADAERIDDGPLRRLARHSRTIWRNWIPQLPPNGQSLIRWAGIERYFDSKAESEQAHERWPAGHSIQWIDVGQGLRPALNHWGGIYCPEDGWVSPKPLVESLLESACVKGALLVATDAPPLDFLSSNFDAVVVATGAFPFAQLGLTNLIRPIRGQIIDVAAPSHGLSHPVCLGSLYAVPRGADTLTIGATVEEVGLSSGPTAEGLGELLAFWTALTGLTSEPALYDVRVGFRPSTPDKLPLIGPTPYPSVFAALAPYRHGIALAPAMAEIVIDHVEMKETLEESVYFGYGRFDV